MQLPSALVHAAYRVQQASWLVNATAFHTAMGVLSRGAIPNLDLDTIRTLAERRRALYATDWHNVKIGMYPQSLLFSHPYVTYAKALPQLLRDLPKVARRRRSNDYKDIPSASEAAKDEFPAYYRRAFHWQSDGYFSYESARKYDLSVEILFRGLGDVMRRQIIPPITRFVSAQQSTRLAAGDDKPLRVLDVACGTGRTLQQLAIAHPHLEYVGIDLSRAYIEYARDQLNGVRHLALDVGNAEKLPYADASFDIVTSVYLFHELPRNARRNVARELRRVLRPGGLLVIEDSAQYSDSRAIAEVLEQFPIEYHEPFYRDYLDDDLSDLLREASFTVEHATPHLVAKVVTARG